jgi:3-hydroxyisobutyrate dehydrogenase-like beta-hydroxyacid dehydrogenase
MPLKTVAILSPGDMGHAVGQVLGAHSLRVITCLQGRSERTRSLARRAHIADVASYEALVTEADLLLSILVPAQAPLAAQAIARAIAQTSADIVYADCNAIAPQTARQIGEVISAVGGRFVDASIVGPPPRREGTTRFYASGPDASAFEALREFGLDVVVLDDEIGRASALKMCYAALTKGLTALCTELLTAAQVLGVSAALSQEFQISQAALYQRMERGLPRMPAKSRRWVGEMEEISRTFERVGLTPKILAGAADMYRFVAQTDLADRVPEDSEPPPSLAKMISLLAASLRGQERDLNETRNTTVPPSV